MTPADNVLYFNDDIDIRLCLKNGYTTLRHAWLTKYDPIYLEKLNGGQINSPSSSERYNMVMLKMDVWDQPFRRGSYRIAIKRDPIERFMSAIYYLEQTKLYYHHKYVKKNYIDLTQVDSKNINAVLDAFDNQLLRDEHFFSQSYFMGHPNDYDKVYYLHQMPELLEWLERKIKCKTSFKGIWRNQNPSLDKVKLTHEQQMRIIKMYAKDYANGWY